MTFCPGQKLKAGVKGYTKPAYNNELPPPLGSRYFNLFTGWRALHGKHHALRYREQKILKLYPVKRR
ncbi:transcriptional regulator, MerR family [Pseudomonas syringae pv. tomato T1]|nr:transcriptional regulator, MerR family [Pseudomonas syringae pv. tomato T1]